MRVCESEHCISMVKVRTMKRIFSFEKREMKKFARKKPHANKISKTHLFVNKIQIHFSIRFSEVALQIFLLKLF